LIDERRHRPGVKHRGIEADLGRVETTMKVQPRRRGARARRRKAARETRRGGEGQDIG
jgi:hypothetical protein